jgi:predicted DNA-binding transcriptional regulator AlpA
MMNTSRTQQMLTLPAAARRVGVGVRAIYRASRCGELPVYEVDSWPRVRLQDVTRWLESRRRPPAAIDNVVP